MMKGAGFSRAPDKRELDNEECITKSFKAEEALYKSVKKSLSDPASVAKGFSPNFMPALGSFMDRAGQSSGISNLVDQLNAQLSDIGKNFTLTTPLATGLVPYDLVAPSRLIYPVYSPMRNRLPRVPGVGTSHRAKVLTGISGSQTGVATLDAAIPELVTGGGTLANWPLNLPGSGTQAASDINIPYKFFGVSEAASFLAQWAGQGFEDASALANLVLIQEAMLAEEYQLMQATGTVVQTPGQPTLTPRTAGTGESNLTGITTNLYVKVTALNFFGETVVSASQSTAITSQVCDVTITPSRGAAYYRIYAGTGTTDPGAAGYHLMADNVGGTKYTLQGALPTGTANAPTADTGTFSANRYEGLLSILDGHSVTDAAVYPAGFTGGYVNNKVGDTLNSNVVNTALQSLWDGTSAFRANPSELVCEGGDAVRFSNDIRTNAALNYRLTIDQSEVGGIRGGAAISEYVNPVTRSIVAITVHPWQQQGVAYLLSYTLPQPYSNVSNVFENVMVQDLVGIQWPVIDASYRFSAFWMGALVCYAPQYNGILKGLQVSNTTPYS
jgi:hypothetical protein